MKISLITATFNSERFIQSCLNSILSQDFDNIECIIVDGLSNDNTLSLVRKKIKDFKHIKIISEPDKGIYDALNKGVEVASGDVIGFVHSDDVLASKKIISEIVSKFEIEHLDGIYGDLEYVDKKNTSKIIRYWKSCDFEYKLIKDGWMPPHPTLFLKKNVYELSGLFDLNFKISADYDFILRIFKDEKFKFGYLPKVIMKMRVGGISNQNFKNILLKSKEDYLAIKKNNVGDKITLFKKNISKINQFINHFIHNSL